MDERKGDNGCKWDKEIKNKKREEGLSVKTFSFKMNFCVAICKETLVEKISVLSMSYPYKIVCSCFFFVNEGNFGMYCS